MIGLLKILSKLPITVLISLFLMVTTAKGQPYILVLGTAQDGGYPHIGCQKQCCDKVWSGENQKIHVVSLALVNPKTKQWWLFEATPDIKDQLQYFSSLTSEQYNYLPDGIFITHAHMGHYTGLAQLGREALGAKNVKVYALPKMKAFLEKNGPWQQLVALQNISIQELQPNSILGLSNHIKIQTFTVPHRDEYSETAGFTIRTSEKKYLFIPDIDKWSKWEQNIIDVVQSVDIALVDATFNSGDELPGRKIELVPHPFVSETLELFKNTLPTTKAKIHFIHMNHTNPLLWNADMQRRVQDAGFHYAKQGMKL